MEIQQFCFKEEQQQFIDSLPNDKKYYRSNYMYYDILLEEEYNKLPREKEIIYHEISKSDYIETCYNIVDKEMPPCIIDPKYFPKMDLHKWKRDNSVSTPLALKIF